MDEQTLLQLERYLDGVLSTDERHDFEARLNSDPVLQQAVRQQREIDSALRRLVPAPVAAPMVTPMSGASADVVGTLAPSPANPWLRRLAIAAVVCAGLFGIWSTWQQLKPIDDSRTVAAVSPEQYYRDQVRNNMHAYYVCDPESAKFADYFREHLGQPLLMKANDPGFKCLGVNKCNSLSPSTLAVLIRLNEMPVVVLIDKKQCGANPLVSPGSGLHAHRRDLGSLILVELSPADHPQVLDMFLIPDEKG